MRPQKKTLFGNSEGTGSRAEKWAAFLILFCVLAFVTAGVTARYLQKTETNDTAVAKEFYFESDLLDGQVHEIAPMDSDGTGSVTVTLMNHADALRYSEVDIDYTVSVSEVLDAAGDASSNDDAIDGGSADGTQSAAVQSAGEGSSGAAAQADESTEDETTTDGIEIKYNSGKEIKAGAVNDSTVTISGLKPGKTYTVTATTNNTYSKTLTGTIKVNDIDRELHASLADKGPYIEVNVWSVDAAHNGVTLTYCEGLIPDNTDSLMENEKTATASSTNGASGAGTENVTGISLEKNTSHMFRFFKSNTEATYEVGVSGDTVTISQPQSAQHDN